MNAVYSMAKIFHHGAKLDDLAAGRSTAPIHVRLKPTNRCNHSCFYCCYRNRALPLSERMVEHDQIPHHKMREIVADIVRMRVKAVTFSGGGEPLMYPHMAETIRRLATGGVKIAMLTNGSLLEGEVAELLATRATWLRVSIDADNGSDYAKSRGVSEKEFGRVCHNIRSFAAMSPRTCTIGANFIVTRQNAARVMDFLQMAKELGFEQVKLSMVVVGTSPEANERYMSPIYQSVKDQIQKAQTILADHRFAITDKVHLPDATEESFTRNHTRCPFIQCLTVIGADQNVYVCQDKAYTTAGLLGSIRDRSFSDLWFDEDTKQRLQSLNPSRECLHHCVAQAKNTLLLDYLDADCGHLEFV